MQLPVCFAVFYVIFKVLSPSLAKLKLTNLHGHEKDRSEEKAIFGFLNEEQMRNRTVCTSLFQHRSSRVLRVKGVQ